MEKLRIHCFQHIPFENLGWIATWAQERGHALSYTCFFEAEATLPDVAAIDWLIILGGAMGCADEAKFPWLAQEKVLIQEAVAAGKVVLGICLGAQLLAHCLGAEVYPHTHQEIGFRDVTFTEPALQDALFKDLPPKLKVFQWHGETFSIPAGATQVAFSDVCQHQAFKLGKSIGLQFHWEATPGIIRDMVQHDGHELVEAPYIDQAEKILSEVPLAGNSATLLYPFLDKLAQL